MKKKILEKNSSKASALKNQEKVEAEKLEEQENLRSEKLMSSKDNNRKTIIFFTSFFAMVFAIYFIVTYVLETNMINQMNVNMNHLKVISLRAQSLKYLRDFTVERILNEKKAGDFTYKYNGCFI